MHLAELKMREIGGRSLLKKKNFYATVNLLPTNALAHEQSSLLFRRLCLAR